jgi:hypothetical protein
LNEPSKCAIQTQNMKILLDWNFIKNNPKNLSANILNLTNSYEHISQAIILYVD